MVTKKELSILLNLLKDFILGGIFVGFSYFALYWVTIKTFNLDKCIEYKTVRAVGGCSLFGTCGVEFDDGSFGEAKRPVVNLKVCTDYSNYEMDKKFFF